jgi:hypothetical protein
MEKNGFAERRVTSYGSCKNRRCVLRLLVPANVVLYCTCHVETICILRLTIIYTVHATSMLFPYRISLLSIPYMQRRCYFPTASHHYLYRTCNADAVSLSRLTIIHTVHATSMLFANHVSPLSIPYIQHRCYFPTTSHHYLYHTYNIDAISQPLLTIISIVYATSMLFSYCVSPLSIPHMRLSLTDRSCKPLLHTACHLVSSASTKQMSLLCPTPLNPDGTTKLSEPVRRIGRG